MPTAAFYTLGCKVNQHDSFSLMRSFEAAGFEITPHTRPADVYIVNSCTVTAAGERKSLQALRRFRRQNPGAVVVLCGCFPQAFPEKAGEIEQADIVMGSKNRAALLSAVTGKLAGKQGRLVDIPAHCQGDTFEDLDAPALSTRTRAFLKIQDGCERDCAYCIVPAARGPVRSKPPEDIRKRLEELVAAGHKEVVLTGINLSCYGQDLGLRLSDAVELSCRVEGLNRLRLGSLEPDLITDEDISRWAAFRLPGPGRAVLCDHFHLCLQSGCERTLQRMNRRYTAGNYRQTVRGLRAAFPGCAVTTDIMVGFPGEKQGDHDASVAFVREMGFADAHVFVYSPRAGTAAAGLPDQISAEVASVRAKDMTAAVEDCRDVFLRSRLGGVYSVLFESKRGGLYCGHTACHVSVWVRSVGDIRGEVLVVRLTEPYEDGCIGEVIL